MIIFENELNALFKKITFNMHQAGVKILAGSDAGAFNSFVYPGIALHKELYELVDTGLTPLQALQSSTLNGAQFFGDFDQHGSINKNKEADLLILDENPLQNILNTQKIYAVVANGTLYNQINLEALLNE